MLEFIDFAPRKAGTKNVLIFSVDVYEDFAAAAAAADAWLESHNVELVQIETVVLPNIHDDDEEGTTDSDLRTAGEYGSSWYQFVRIWYRPVQSGPKS